MTRLLGLLGSKALAKTKLAIYQQGPGQSQRSPKGNLKPGPDRRLAALAGHDGFEKIWAQPASHLTAVCQHTSAVRVVLHIKHSAPEHHDAPDADRVTNLTFRTGPESPDLPVPVGPGGNTGAYWQVNARVKSKPAFPCRSAQWLQLIQLSAATHTPTRGILLRTAPR